VLEGESGQLSLGFERVLPDLGRNIQCGNSLIGEDYFAGQLVVDEEERRRVNPFEWQNAFPQVFANGGFDAVIGNPPYVRQEGLGKNKQYFQKCYQVYTGTADLYSFFIEKGVSLLAPRGQFGFIVANKWMRANYGESLRRWLKTKCIDEITDFGDLPVFEGATTYPCIIRISNLPPHFRPHVTLVKTLTFPSLSEFVETNGIDQDQTKFSDNGWSLANIKTQQILEKLSLDSSSLDKYIDGKMFRGVLTGLNEAFVIDKNTRDQLIEKDPKNAELIKPFLIGKDIKRYKPPESQRFIILIPKGWTKEKSEKMANAGHWFQQNYPGIYKHLEPYSQAAEKRWDKGDHWWELRACDYYCEFENPKLIFPDISLRGNFIYDESGGFYSINTTYIIPTNDKYLLGLMNSKLFTFIYSNISSSYRGGYLRYIYQYVSQLPIHIIDYNNPADVKQHERMVALVERMLALHQRSAPTPQEEERLKREIASTDREIDGLVYELYGLAEEEIKIVEGQ
jgi:hypothetical protein